MGQDDGQSARFLQALRDEITSSLDPKIVLSSLAAGTSRILGATRCSVVEVDPLRHPGRGFVFTAVDDPSIEGYSLDLANYPEIEAALAENRPIRVHDDADDPIAARIRQRHRVLPFPLSVVLPISYREQRFGVLFLRFARADAAIGAEAVALCQMIAFGGAIALNSTREYELLIAETERREHEAEELREALRLRLELLLAASHDLRTPLNSIVGYLELLGDGAYGALDTAQRDVLAHLVRNSMSLLEIINTLIDHGRLERGQVPLRVTAGELSQLLDELRLMIEPLAGVRPVRIRFEASGPLVRLETDWLKLKRILLNLLHNALKFTERGEIALEVSQERGAIRFRVRDTGAGIAPKDLPEIFNPFYRADWTRAEGPGGLGLSIAKRYCEMLHGTISVASRLGEGTEFTVELPVVWPAPAADA